MGHYLSSLAPPYAFGISFNYLTSHHATSAAYLHLLLRWMGIDEEIPVSALTQPYNVEDVPMPSFQFLGESWGDYGNKLFEKEADNWYEEKVRW